MYIQLITFQLDGITEEEFHTSCRGDTEVFASMPGLLAKIWLRDPDSNTYGGLYLWADRDAYQAYIAGDVFRSIIEAPVFSDVESRGLDHFDDLTKATQPGLNLV